MVNQIIMHNNNNNRFFNIDIIYADIATNLYILHKCILFLFFIKIENYGNKKYAFMEFIIIK